MQSVIVSDSTIWFIAHNGVDVFHTGSAAESQEVTTGQPNLETFTSEEAFLSRCAALGISPEPEA